MPLNIQEVDKSAGFRMLKIRYTHAQETTNKARPELRPLGFQPRVLLWVTHPALPPHHVPLAGSGSMYRYLRVTNSLLSNPAAGCVTEKCQELLLVATESHQYLLCIWRQSIKPLLKLRWGKRRGAGGGGGCSSVSATWDAALFANHLIKPSRLSK